VVTAGLFITTHDAMHGTIAMRHRKLNDFLGQLAITCYAWFDYPMLHQKVSTATFGWLVYAWLPCCQHM
jgi:fatty acid desaturase